MILTELSAIETGDLPIAELKEHLRLGTGFPDDTLQDSLVEAYLRSAIATIEGKIGLVLVPRLFSWQLTGWRSDTQQVLPVRPIIEVLKLTRVARDGESTDFDLEQFDFIPDAVSPAIVPISGSFPTIAQGEAVDLVFEAGFSPDWESVPSDLAQAVILLAAHFYEYRSSAPGGSTVMPVAVQALLDRHRPVRLFSGAV